jgi:hypothetical protein
MMAYTHYLDAKYEGDLHELPAERGPNGTGWDNSVAICACIRNENATDVREWILYYKCAPTILAILHACVASLCCPRPASYAR